MKGYRTMAVNVLTILSLCLGTILAGDVRDIDPRVLAIGLVAFQVHVLYRAQSQLVPLSRSVDTRTRLPAQALEEARLIAHW